ncbi:thyroid hormone-inducible hepatic protein [Scleropages formosus]|uniref:Thyroid hormone responsive n=1 Tax=Scleropages formosus TaxID=113540 RepID=A0A8C9SGB3_SCLFO|nr:thyroid hormone-inducible hepatic protein-like [Scleropages formosus]
MQPAETKLPRSSLLRALRHYSSAVRDMEQTVMLPSLLREVLYEEAEEVTGRADLYELYLTLKAIRVTAESGLIPVEDCMAKAYHTLGGNLEPLTETDPETLFHFHLEGLLSVISNLTKMSQAITTKYMDIIGITS